jgi:hypothetical protein
MIVTEEVRGIEKQGKQRRLIEHALLKYGQVSVTDAWEGKYGAKIRRLGARICELREAHWQIRTDARPAGETYYVLIAPPEAQMKLGV